MTLTGPTKNFADTKLVTRDIDPANLVRVSRYNTGEPYFGRTGGNRFDDPRSRGKYGTCYFGFDLRCAFAETVLHDESPDLKLGGFRIATTELERFVLSFAGSTLNVAVLVDGFLYISRHVNTAEALVLFDRAAPKLTLKDAIPFQEYPGAAGVLMEFRVHPL